MRVVARSSVMGIVAGRTAQTALAFGIAGGHRYSNPLKPDDTGILGLIDECGDQSGQPMTFAAQIDFDPGLNGS